MGIDKREHPRYELTAFVEYEARGQLRTHRVQNISAGGMCIHTAFLQTPGTTIEVVVNFPDFEGARVQARGEVVWRSEALQDMGVRFTDLDEAARAVLERYIQRAQPREV